MAWDPGNNKVNEPANFYFFKFPMKRREEVRYSYIRAGLAQHTLPAGLQQPPLKR